MDKSTESLLVKAAVVGAGLYVLYLIYDKIANSDVGKGASSILSTAGKATSAATGIIDKSIEGWSQVIPTAQKVVQWLSSPGAVSVSGGVLLPDGSLVAISDIKSGINDNNQFVFGNSVFTLGPRNAQGYYTAS